MAELPWDEVLEQGNAVATRKDNAWLIEGYDPLWVRSRQDCEDLIALLERVKERLPDGR